MNISINKNVYSKSSKGSFGRGKLGSNEKSKFGSFKKSRFASFKKSKIGSWHPLPKFRPMIVGRSLIFCPFGGLLIFGNLVFVIC